MKTTLVVLLVAVSLAGCATPPAAQTIPAPSPAGAEATPDDDAEALSQQVGVRGIDPEAQKGLVDRMKACCGPAK